MKDNEGGNDGNRQHLLIKNYFDLNQSSLVVFMKGNEKSW